jgi:UDPglucose--hexose-1-phosphate uridylyltransferase
MVALGCGNDTCDVEGSFAMGAQDRREAQRLQPFSSAQEAVCALVSYGVDKALIGEEDRTFAANALLDALRLEPDADFDPISGAAWESLEATLAYLLDDAVARGVCDAGIASRDLLDTRLMGCLTPRPHEVIATFWHNFDSSPEAATDYLYRLSQDSDYIRTYRVAKDLKWVTQHAMAISTLRSPFPSPKRIPELLRRHSRRVRRSISTLSAVSDNEGYAGRLIICAPDHSSYSTYIGDEPWFLQYSPYVYYNEHCIVLSRTHMPMHISRKTFGAFWTLWRSFPIKR